MVHQAVEGGYPDALGLREGLQQVGGVVGHLAVEAHEQQRVFLGVGGVRRNLHRLLQQLGQKAQGFAAAGEALDAHDGGLVVAAGMLQNLSLVVGGFGLVVQQQADEIGFCNYSFHVRLPFMNVCFGEGWPAQGCAAGSGGCCAGRSARGLRFRPCRGATTRPLFAGMRFSRCRGRRRRKPAPRPAMWQPPGTRSSLWGREMRPVKFTSAGEGQNESAAWPSRRLQRFVRMTSGGPRVGSGVCGKLCKEVNGGREAG